MKMEIYTRESGERARCMGKAPFTKRRAISTTLANGRQTGLLVKAR